MNKKYSFNLSLTKALLISCGGYIGPISADTTVELSISGVQPDKRPIQAKAIENDDKASGCYARALTGLQAPYPSNFLFMEDQEAWYPPFYRI